jgi:hypothetical protein
MIRTELSLRLPNSPGALAGVCRLLSNERVNVLAMMLEGGGQLRLVVDNHTHGGAILREHHHQVTERDVIVTAVPNGPGGLAPILRLVSDANVNVEYAPAADLKAVRPRRSSSAWTMPPARGRSRRLNDASLRRAMDAVLVEVNPDGRVRFENEDRSRRRSRSAARSFTPRRTPSASSRS